MKQGKVYLVGAGPGDPKLMTLKGLECIKRADVIIYDRLVSKRLLAHAKPECELIFGGKYPDHHILRQDEINQVLVQKALEGKTVTRLKGGDPFVFGRGGEEAEELVKHGIAFEVVPGVTSAVAVPAYAGIPVTHRDFTTSFAVITGHLKNDKAETAIRWDKISQGHGTLIFLMGIEKLPMIVSKLLEHGRNAETPVALVRWGTTADQKTLTGLLRDIVEQAKNSNFRSPAVIVVGEVVGLREKLKWFEAKPFFGKRVVVTRARKQAGVLADKIEDLGGEAWEFPVIEIVPPADYAQMDEAIINIKNYSWLIFTSVNGVEYFFGRLQELGRDIRELVGIKICAIGPATKLEIEKHNLRVDITPTEYRAEGVIAALSGQLSPQDRVLLPRAEVAREILPQVMAEMGIPLDVVKAYRTVQGKAEKELLVQMLADKQLDVITFTSSSTVKNFVEMVGLDKLTELTAGVKIASIGPITSATARELGLTVDVEAAKYTIDGLVQGILQYFEGIS